MFLDSRRRLNEAVEDASYPEVRSFFNPAGISVTDRDCWFRRTMILGLLDTNPDSSNHRNHADGANRSTSANQFDGVVGEGRRLKMGETSDGPSRES